MADKTENKPGFVARAKAAVKNFFGNTDLLLILLVGVGMVGIHDGSHVLQVLSGIFLEKKTKIFVMVVRTSRPTPSSCSSLSPSQRS